MQYLGLMFGGSGMFEAALVICFFWAALAHPDRIQKIRRFRLAALLLVTAMVAPVLLQLFLKFVSYYIPEVFGARSDELMMVLTLAIGTILKMLALLLGLDSMTSSAKDRGA